MLISRQLVKQSSWVTPFMPWRCVSTSLPPTTGLQTDSPDRGEGANHVILDVQDFVKELAPALQVGSDFASLRSALDRYEEAVVARTRPAVLASRQACLHAHNWSKISNESPLLTRRMPFVEFDETQLESQ